MIIITPHKVSKVSQFNNTSVKPKKFTLSKPQGLSKLLSFFSPSPQVLAQESSLESISENEKSEIIQ